MSDHAYVSTACHHNLHEQCRQVCKFCPEQCRCTCHGERGTVYRDSASFLASLDPEPAGNRHSGSDARSAA